MHASSYNLMSRFRAYVPKGSRVLDVGGANVNGSYRPLFADCEYVTLDFEKADIIVKDYEWPIEARSFDAVVCGQMFEHDRFFWLTMQSIERVLRKGGVAIIIVPSDGPQHRYPVDCYRFLPDSMKALADWVHLELLETHWSDTGRWRDLAGVFRKSERGS